MGNGSDKDSNSSGGEKGNSSCKDYRSGIVDGVKGTIDNSNKSEDYKEGYTQGAQMYDKNRTQADRNRDTNSKDSEARGGGCGGDK